VSRPHLFRLFLSVLVYSWPVVYKGQKIGRAYTDRPDWVGMRDGWISLIMWPFFEKVAGSGSAISDDRIHNQYRAPVALAEISSQ